MSLFDAEPYTVDTRDAARTHARDTYPLLRILDLDINVTSPHYPLVEVELVRGAQLLEPGHGFYFLTIEAEDDDDEAGFSDMCGWTVRYTTATPKSIRGFLNGVFLPQATAKGPVMRIDADCTNVDETRVGVFLSDIESVGVYPPEQAELLVAYQNAWIDGDTSFWQQYRGYPTEPYLTAAELEPYLTTLWPAAKTVYTRPTSA